MKQIQDSSGTFANVPLSWFIWLKVVKSRYIGDGFSTLLKWYNAKSLITNKIVTFQNKLQRVFADHSFCPAITKGFNVALVKRNKDYY